MRILSGLRAGIEPGRVCLGTGGRGVGQQRTGRCDGIAKPAGPNALPSRQLRALVMGMYLRVGVAMDPVTPFHYLCETQ